LEFEAKTKKENFLKTTPDRLQEKTVSPKKKFHLIEFAFDEELKNCDVISGCCRHDDDNVMRINSESNDVATPINNDHQTSSSVAKRGSKMMSGVGGVTLTTTTTTERSRYPFSFSAASRNVAIHVSTVATLLTLTFLSAFRRFIVF